jgi:biopolymer transport protein ExbD
MAAETGDGDSPIVGINVTPLVDVVLVLLVVLMVSAPLLASKVLPLDLPRAATGSEQQTILAVELGADGRTVVNQRPVEGDEALLDTMRQAAAADSALRAVIHADGAVPHRRVVQVMDLLRRARVSRIAFGVQPGDAVGARASTLDAPPAEDR